LLGVEPTFRTITNRFIYINLKTLIINDIEFKKTALEKTNQIDINHKIQLDTIFLNILKRIKYFISNNKLIRETGFELFENEWRNFKSCFNTIIESLISKPYLLIPFNLEDIIEGKIKNSV